MYVMCDLYVFYTQTHLGADSAGALARTGVEVVVKQQAGFLYSQCGVSVQAGLQSLDTAKHYQHVSGTDRGNHGNSTGHIVHSVEVTRVGHASWSPIYQTHSLCQHKWVLEQYDNSF